MIDPMPTYQATMVSPRLMRVFADTLETVRFVEIGANDGVILDPLRPYIAERDWHGVLVEPIPHIFERLERNYGDNPRIALERAAIAPSSGSRTMYFVLEGADDEGLPPWRDALGSFDRDHVLTEIGGAADPESHLGEVEVPCMTVETLCRKHGFDEPDLILIDAEGADGEIIESIDFDRIRPRLLVYEHVNLADEQRRRCEQMLAARGYALVADGLDTWSLDVLPDDALSGRWRSILEGLG
jgi:FkbM family methyltransferase